MIRLIQNSKSKIQNLLKHPGFRRYGANTAWLFAEQILRMIAGFLVGLWVARYLGPEKYGLSICPTGVENLKICQNYIDFNVGGDFK